MDCPKLIREDYCYCAVINEFDKKPIHCPESKHSPCNRCKLHWTDTPPDKNSLNIVLIEEIKKPKVVEQPSIIQQAITYTEAVIDQAFFGSEVPEEVVQEREAECKKCPNYQNGKCGLCGCWLEGGTYQNKLKMSNQRCPDNPPRWVEYRPESV